MRVAAVLLLTATLLSVSAQIAGAITPEVQTTPSTRGDTPTVELSTSTNTPGQAGGTGGNRGGAASTIRCEYRELGTGSADGGFNYGDAAVTDFTEGRQVFRVCTDTATGELTSTSIVTLGPGAGPIAPAVTGRQVAEIAVAQLPIALPQPHLNPPTQQIIHIPTWLWTADQGQPTASASLAGVTATVTATLDKVVWDTGDGDTVTCTTAGTPYDAARPAATQRTTCSHTPNKLAGPVTVTATVHWDISYTATDGTNGALAPQTRTTSIDSTITELRTLTRNH